MHFFSKGIDLIFHQQSVWSYQRYRLEDEGKSVNAQIIPKTDVSMAQMTFWMYWTRPLVKIILDDGDIQNARRLLWRSSGNQRVCFLHNPPNWWSKIWLLISDNKNLCRNEHRTGLFDSASNRCFEVSTVLPVLNKTRFPRKSRLPSQRVADNMPGRPPYGWRARFNDCFSNYLNYIKRTPVGRSINPPLWGRYSMHV